MKKIDIYWFVRKNIPQSAYERRNLAHRKKNKQTNIQLNKEKKKKTCSSIYRCLRRLSFDFITMYFAYFDPIKLDYGKIRDDATVTQRVRYPLRKRMKREKKRQQQQRFTIKRCFRFTDDNNKGWVLFAGVLNMKCLCQGKSEKKSKRISLLRKKNDMYCYSFMSKPNHTSNLKLKFNPSEIWKIDQKMKFRQIFCHMQIVRELLIWSFRSCSSMNWTSCFGATHFLWITLANQLQIQ